MRVLPLLFLALCSEAVVFVHLTDTHIGYGCGEPYNGTDECPTVQHALTAVQKINELIESEDVEAVFVTGDLTQSAEATEYAKVKQILNGLKVPYYPLLGNHDVWTHTNAEEEPSPTGDAKFAATFNGILTGSAHGFVNHTVFNVKNNITSQFINWWWRSGETLFIALDLCTRDHSLDQMGAGTWSEWHNFTGGTLPWLQAALAQAQTVPPHRIVLLHHHPYHCPWGLPPDFYFCMSDDTKATYRAVLSSYFPVDVYYGAAVGHTHVYDAEPLDKWPGFMSWTTTACKVDAINTGLTSGFTLFKAPDGGNVTTVKYCVINNAWTNSCESL